jgi:hypothetical protein
MDRLSLLVRFVDHCPTLSITAHNPQLTLYASYGNGCPLSG